MSGDTKGGGDRRKTRSKTKTLASKAPAASAIHFTSLEEIKSSKSTKKNGLRLNQSGVAGLVSLAARRITLLELCARESGHDSSHRVNIHVGIPVG